MHMLEDHMIPWLEQWHVGMGLMGEQGAESIHAAFNRTERRYTNMPEKVERMKCLMTEHHRQVCPPLVDKQPVVKHKHKKRKTS